jgi:hypothetical protein
MPLPEFFRIQLAVTRHPVGKKITAAYIDLQVEANPSSSYLSQIKCLTNNTSGAWSSSRWLRTLASKKVTVLKKLKLGFLSVAIYDNCAPNQAVAIMHY